MNRFVLLALIPLAISTPALAQQMDHAAMPGMAMPAPKPPPAKPAEAVQDPAPKAEPGTPAANAAPAEIPKTQGPPPPTDHAADRYFDPTAMAAARTVVLREHGGVILSTVMANIAEYQARSRGEDGYRWEGQAWYGGDINRFVLKTEGEGSRAGGLEAAEAQALYSHAIGPYFDLQAGLRQDFSPHARTYATVGLEGLSPYWFDVQGAVFLSTEGELLGRAEASYDLRLTQRVILQPRVEVNLAAQDSVETRIGSGVSNAEFGLRLRYEITRQFAPYVGVSYDRKFGRTGDYARALGEDVEATSFVVGIRTSF